MDLIHNSVILFVTCMLVLMPNSNTQTIDDANNLMSNVLSGYNKYVRPQVDQSQPTIINVTFYLVSVRDVDAISRTITIVGFLYFTWIDPRVTWNPYAYNGTIFQLFPHQDVWKPDLVIARPTYTTMAVGYHHTWIPVRYYFNGYAIYGPGDVFSTTCDIDVKVYPFDTQVCDVTFMPWGYTVYCAFVVPEDTAMLNYFTEHGEWNLESAKTESLLFDGTHPAFVVKLTLRRRPTYVAVNVMLPVLFMSFLNVLAFLLPADSGERTSYAITVLLASAVFLTLVSDNLPKTSQPMPNVCHFLLTNLVLSSLIVAIVILNLSVYHMSDTSAKPRWLTVLTCLVLRRNTHGNTLRKCQTTEVQEIDISSHKETDFHGKGSCERWAVKNGLTEPEVTWKEVSFAVDRISGIGALLWLSASIVVFFIIVTTQVPTG